MTALIDITSLFGLVGCLTNWQTNPADVNCARVTARGSLRTTHRSE